MSIKQRALIIKKKCPRLNWFKCMAIAKKQIKEIR